MFLVIVSLKLDLSQKSNPPPPIPYRLMWTYHGIFNNSWKRTRNFSMPLTSHRSLKNAHLWGFAFQTWRAATLLQVFFIWIWDRWPCYLESAGTFRMSSLLWGPMVTGLPEQVWCEQAWCAEGRFYGPERQLMHLPFPLRSSSRVAGCWKGVKLANGNISWREKQLSSVMIAVNVERSLPSFLYCNVNVQQAALLAAMFKCLKECQGFCTDVIPREMGKGSLCFPWLYPISCFCIFMWQWK